MSPGAMYHGHHKIVREFIVAGAVVNLTDAGTVLMAAAVNQCLDVVREWRNAGSSLKNNSD